MVIHIFEYFLSLVEDSATNDKVLESLKQWL